MPINIKKYTERRAELVAQMEALVGTCQTENRAFNDEDTANFAKMTEEIRSIDSMLNAAEAIEGAKKVPAVKQTETRSYEEMTVEERAAVDEKNFADYVLGRVTELRAGEQNVGMANNGAIIPTSISNRIIKAVKDRCPILAGATMYAVKGTLKVPVWGKANTTHDITVGYQTEFTDITADAGKFTSVDLGGYLAGALTLIGKSVENNGAFNVTDFIVNQMAEEIASFIEGELVKGSGSSAATGALNTTNTVTAAGTSAVTGDELIALQASVKQAYQQNACWTMNPATFTAIKKLKDGNGVYLLQRDFTDGFPYRLLGKPVYLSDNMPTMAASAKAILYGDYTGLSVNFRENISIQILREKYATQHAIGVVSWFEFDSKVTDNAKLAALVMAAS